MFFGYAFLSINSNLFLLVFNHKKTNTMDSHSLLQKEVPSIKFLVSLCLIDGAVRKHFHSRAVTSSVWEWFLKARKYRKTHCERLFPSLSLEHFSFILTNCTNKNIFKGKIYLSNDEKCRVGRVYEMMEKSWKGMKDYEICYVIYRSFNRKLLSNKSYQLAKIFGENYFRSLNRDSRYLKRRASLCVF